MTELDESEQQHLKEWKEFKKEISSWMECSITTLRLESVDNCIRMMEAKRDG